MTYGHRERGGVEGNGIRRQLSARERVVERRVI